MGVAELTADLDALRALARSLVHGDPDADDLVQDAALAALEHPPATDRPVRPWLATVLRNRWRFLHRGATRRAAREQAVAAAEAAPAADELLERARTFERLAAALVALDEPFREVVIRRYLDGQSAADIARALGVPAGTVRWRLKIGLDRLRAALDRAEPRRRWQLALVAGVPVKTKSSSLVVVLVLLLLAAGAAVFVLGPGRGGGAPPPAAPAGGTGAAAPAVPSAPRHVAVAGGDPAVVPADPLPGQGRATVAAIAAPGGAFAGRVINWSTGDGVAGAELSFSAGGDVITVHSGDDGGFELRPPGPGTYALVSADADGFLPYAPEWRHSSVRLAARPDQRVGGLTVFLFPAIDYRGTVVDASGAPVAGARVRLLGSPTGEQALAGPATRWTSDRDGHFVFHAPDDAVLEAEHARGRGRAVLDGDVALTRELVIQLGDAPAADATIAGRVVDGDGQPEAGVLVRALPIAERVGEEAQKLRALAFATSDGDGRFVLTGLDRGRYDVSATVDERAPAVQRGVAGGTRDVVLTLDDGALLSGAVVDGTGAAVPAFTLLVYRRDGVVRELVNARSVVDARGRFALRVPEGAYDLMAAAPGWAPSAPTRASTGDEVTLQVSTGATLRGKVVRAGDGAPVAYARIMREAPGGGASAQPANAGRVSRVDGTFELTGVPPGPVSITVGAGDFHPRIEAGLVATDGAVLGPLVIELRPIAPGEQPSLELVGIGIQLAAAPDGLQVIALVPGGGAAAAGVVPGDVVLAVDGADVATTGLDGAIARIRGVAGTRVRITLRRGDAPVELSIERRAIKS